MVVTSIRMVSVAVLPYRTGRYVPHAPGDVIPISDLAEALVRRLGDAFLSGVLVVE